ncbi:MAG: hypothetical protein LBS72_02805 [Oscillospiraceae bacterium]|jgi:uncharacterized membrane protein YcgQ (UPF0703/DUF1980 family)|nr:hypothetical protein [Oscillospiraceae bacterium]
MRKYLALAIVCLLFLAGCSANSAPTDSVSSGGSAKTVSEVLEITEKLFIAQCNDIYINQNDFIGKTVRIEGMYDEYSDVDGNLYRAVVRNGPGCCGNDGVAGFEFTTNAAIDCNLSDWISVEGVITPVTYSDGYSTVIIGDASVVVKTERGSEFVSQ